MARTMIRIALATVLGLTVPLALAQSQRPTSKPATSSPGKPLLRRYFDTVNKLSFSYPSAWKEMTPAEAREVMGASTSQYLTMVLFDPKDQTQNVNVQILPAEAENLSEAAFTEFAKVMDRQLSDTVPGAQELSSRVGRLGDMASLEYVLEVTRPDGVRIRQKQLRTGKPMREIVITFTALAEAYDMTDEACFKVIANTLRLE